MFSKIKKSNWSLLFLKIKTEYPLFTSEKYLLISDHRKGTASALTSVYPNFHHSNCSFHVYFNSCKKKTTDEYVQKAYYDASKALFSNKFNYFMGE